MNAQQILSDLIAFPTVSDQSNLDLIDYVEKYLSDMGVSSTRVYDETGIKAALYANVGPNISGGIVLSGHSDVVPVAGQDWDTDPYTLIEKDGKLFGRGTCDMKGFLALALAAVPRALAANLKRPMQIAISYDEEIGLYGAPPMIDHMRAGPLPKADAVIVGEPTGMQVVTGHKGGIGFDVQMRGHEVHSSIMNEGVSAIMMAAKLIDWANEINTDGAAATPSTVGAEFYPPYSTAHVGRITGGTASNITAKDCRFDFDIRLLPDEDRHVWVESIKSKIETIAAQMSKIHPDAGIDVVQDFDLNGLSPETNGLAEQIARKITGDNATHMVSFATEGGQFQERGYSCVVCGPGHIDQAHQPNEFISLEQFAKGADFIDGIIEHLSQ
jgi:acetylornithine deacetylase